MQQAAMERDIAWSDEQVATESLFHTNDTTTLFIRMGRVVEARVDFELILHAQTNFDEIDAETGGALDRKIFLMARKIIRRDNCPKF